MAAALVAAASWLLGTVAAQGPAPAEGLANVERRLASGEFAGARAELTLVADALTAPTRAAVTEDVPLLQRLGEAALEVGEAAIARAAFRRCVAMPAGDEPAQFRARLGLAAAILAAAEFASALEMLEREVAAAATLFPSPHADAAQARMLLSRARRRLGDAGPSLELAREALRAFEAALPPDDRRVSIARANLAEALLDTGDVRGALAHAEPAYEDLAAALPEGALELGIARAILGRTLARSREFGRAMALFRENLDALQRSMPADHIHVLQARLNVANGLPANDPERLALAGQALDGYLRTLGAEHFYTQNARLAVAGAHAIAGRWASARPLVTEAVRVLQRDFPRHRMTLTARQNALEVLDHLERPHELARAREDLLREFAARFPPDHPELQSARLQLALSQRRAGALSAAAATLESAIAITESVDLLAELATVRTELGDLPAALSLLERVLERSREVPRLQRLAARQDVAALRVSFDGERALELQQQIVDELADDEGSPLLPRALANLAAMKGQLGDPRGALELQRRVVALLGDGDGDEPARLRARGNLAESLGRAGDPAAAAAALRPVVAAWQARPDGAFESAVLRANLAFWTAEAGDVVAAQELVREALAAIAAAGRDADPAVPDCLRRAVQVALRAGDRAETARLARQWAAAVRSRLLGNALSPRESLGWLANHDDVVDVLAALACGTAGQPADASFVADWLATVEVARSAVAGQGRARWRRLPEDVRHRLERLEDEMAAAAAAVAASSRAGGTLREAVEASDRAQREHAAFVQQLGGDVASPSGAVDWRGLPPTVGAVALRAFTPRSARGEALGPPVLAALVVARDLAPRCLQLGDFARLQAMAADLERNGMRSAAWVELRALVLDPIRAALPAATELVLAVDGALQSVPWDALELADGRLVGAALRIRLVPSLGELGGAAAVSGERTEARLFVCGGIDYGTPTVVDAAASGSRASTFAALPATRDEIAAIVAVGGAAEPPMAMASLGGAHAGKQRVIAELRTSTLVHLATHGYFDAGLAGPGAGDGLLPRIAPQVLCGLALSGANRGPDAAGRHPGIVTAEELAALDLSGCELVVLSACEGAVGALVRGRGLASLRGALRAAGARCVVAASWRVGDEATSALMTDFYRRLLQQPAAARDVPAALWQARMAARERGAEFRDWAGWTVLGR